LAPSAKCAASAASACVHGEYDRFLAAREQLAERLCGEPFDRLRIELFRFAKTGKNHARGFQSRRRDDLQDLARLSREFAHSHRAFEQTTRESVGLRCVASERARFANAKHKSARLGKGKWHKGNLHEWPRWLIRIGGL
jgi:hypothetical protein